MTGLEMKYFVLKPKGSDAYAKASRLAMATYAKAIADENSQLASELYRWVRDEQTAELEKRT